VYLKLIGVGNTFPDSLAVVAYTVEWTVEWTSGIHFPEGAKKVFFCAFR